MKVRMTPEALYMQLGRLLQTMPANLSVRATEPIFRWLGQLDALLAEDNDKTNLLELRTAVSALHAATVPYDAFIHAQKITSILHRALAAAELKAPVSLSGSFIPAGNALDAMAAIGRVLGTAKRAVLIVDPYMDEKALTDFVPLAAEGISVRLLADEKDHKPTLRPAQERWVQQYGKKRPLEVRLAPHACCTTDW
jgi:hypothetical protein